MANLVYNEESIQTLEDIEAIRVRPGMYIQKIGSEGIKNLVNEAICNCQDEFTSGRGNKNIWFTMNESTSRFEISDDASGIPIGKLKDIVSKRHTGGKFNTNAYKFGNGQNGIGVKCICALSEYFEVIVYRDDLKATIKYSKGQLLEDVIVTKNPRQTTTGTTVIFIPDITVLGDITVKSAEYEDYLNKFVHINAGTKIHYRAILRNGKVVTNTFYSKNGIVDYLTAILKKYTSVLPEPIAFPMTMDKVTSKFGDHEVTREMGLQLVCNWCKDTRSQVILSFVNGIQTINDGCHVKGVQKGFAEIIRHDIKSGKFVAKSDPLYNFVDTSDYFEGFFCIINALHESPLFDGQTKNMFSSADYEGFAKNVISQKFMEWSRLNSGKYRGIIDTILLAARGRLAASKARLQIREGSSQQIVLAGIKGFTACRSKNAEECELFILEGESAGGSAKSCSNSEYQAIYAMRGKPLNAYRKKDIGKYLKADVSSVISDVPKILGCGSKRNFNIERLRYYKIIIMTDADYDGSHIRALLLGYFYQNFPDLIINGHIYIANAPLYYFGFKKSKKSGFYVLNDIEYFEIIEHSIMQEFELCVCDFATKNISPITDRGFYKQFLINIRDYKTLLFVTSKQTNINPRLLEILIVYYDTIHNVEQPRFLPQFKGYFNKEHNCWTIEGIYENIFHKIDFTEFLWNTCSALIMRIKRIRYANLVLRHRKIGTIVGPGYYKITSAIESLINNTVIIQRFKGLGEMNPDQLWETTMNPVTRTLTQVTMDMIKITEYEKALDTFIGNDLISRKAYYTQYL